MTCARCGNAIHRVPMFDLPRKVKEFSCMGCGERFWTIQGEVTVFRDLKGAKTVADSATPAPPSLEFTTVSHRN